MPITRNQRNSKTSSPGPADSAKPQDTNQVAVIHELTSPSSTPDLSDDRTRVPSPHAPRLRDRRSLATTKPFGTTVPSDYILNRLANKRAASTTPPIKLAPKRPCENASASSSKTASSNELSASSRTKSVDGNGGISLLQKPDKPDLSQSVDTVARSLASSSSSSSSAKPNALQLEAKRNDYTRAKSSTLQVGSKAIEQVIQNVRASLSSQSANNRKIDLSETTCSPDRNKIRPPVRISLPNSSSRKYGLSNNSDRPTTSTNESRQIEIINLNPSLLRKSQSTNSFNHSDANLSGPLNLVASKSLAGQVQSTVDKIFNVLIAVTGSVAAVKLLDLIKCLKSKFPQTYASRISGKTFRSNLRIKIILTENAKHFLPTKQKIYEALNDLTIEIHDDADEWSQWRSMGDPVLHIELRKWADLMVIAPLDANTMAKIATGICDNLLTCVVRAWDVSKKLLYCPAMNVHMYNHPITREQLCKLQSFGYLRIDCIEKRLACGDVGMGAMASVETIAEKVAENLLRPVSRPSLSDQRILNKQPTYPIMSTNIDMASSSRMPSLNSYDKFSSPSRPITNVSNNTLPMIKKTDNRFSSTGIYGQSHAKSFQSSLNLVVTRKDQITHNSTNGSAHTSNSKINSHRPNFVTSLKNLQAINNDTLQPIELTTNGTDNTNEDDNDECIIEQSTPESCNSEWSYNGFDPTDVLEQSLITEDNSLTNNGFGNSNGASFQMNGSSMSGSSLDGLSRIDRTPFFNTTKFLNICFDKDRNCYTCAMCKSDYKNRKSIARHLKEQHIQGNIFHCVPCGMSYKRREKLIKHNRERHGIDGIAL